MSGTTTRAPVHAVVAREFAGGTTFQNHGYWMAATRAYPEAATNLMCCLLDLAPAGDEERPGAFEVLDVACGQGATTQFLGSVFGPERVTGIDISVDQLAVAHDVAPRSDLAVMDAVRLDFLDASFDLVICVEAAFEFDSRREFLEEVLRVLRPGGYLALSDFILEPTAGRRALVPDDELVDDPRAYEDLLLDVGFDEVVVDDATEECFAGFLRAFRAFLRRSLVSGALSPAASGHLARRLRAREAITSYYVLAGGRRPPEDEEG